MRRARVPALCLVLAALACELCACAAQEHASPAAAPTPSTAAPLDAAGWVARLHSAHLHADADVQAGAIERAVDGLRTAAQGSVPQAVRPTHRRAVLQDLWFRIAQLELQRDRPGVALTAAETGLALGRARDVFEANLSIVRGEALEAEGRDTEAAASYYEALQINAELLRKALGSPDAGAP